MLRRIRKTVSSDSGLIDLTPAASDQSAILVIAIMFLPLEIEATSNLDLYDNWKAGAKRKSRKYQKKNNDFSHCLHFSLKWIKEKHNVAEKYDKCPKFWLNIGQII